MKGATFRIFAAIGVLTSVLILVYATAFALRHIPQGVRTSSALLATQSERSSQSTIADSWSYTFNAPGVLHEASRVELSSSPYWWLSSGGKMIIENDYGHTILRALDSEDEWHWRYERNNPLDTDAGRYPQNLFRLLTKSIVGDASVSVTFQVRAIHMTDTPNRDGYSGFFIMSRVTDQDNLYYGGIRQDGHVVIKKKIDGIYHTLAERPFFSTVRPYNRDTNPNLIPGQQWMRLRLTTKARSDGVHLMLSLDTDNSDTWTDVLTVLDTHIGGIAHSQPGRTGIRSDFMDVAFDNFIVEIQ